MGVTPWRFESSLGHFGANRIDERDSVLGPGPFSSGTTPRNTILCTRFVPKRAVPSGTEHRRQAVGSTHPPSRQSVGRLRSQHGSEPIDRNHWLHVDHAVTVRTKHGKVGYLRSHSLFQLGEWHLSESIAPLREWSWRAYISWQRQSPVDQRVSVRGHIADRP